MTRRLQTLKQQLLWKYYYKYRSIGERDADGGYKPWQQLLMAAHYTKTSLAGDYWTAERLGPEVNHDPAQVADLIAARLGGDAPCMIARYGANEQRVVANFLAIRSGRHRVADVITGKSPYWWWNKMLRRELVSNAGFFPNETAAVERYAELMLQDSRQLDVLLTWYGYEPLILGEAYAHMAHVGLYEAEPWWQQRPWTRCLEGRRVLVVHPYADLMAEQYRHRRHLFRREDILPAFDLMTVSAVQSIGGQGGRFADWFAALGWMKDQMDRHDYDIALIGCGAYGFCLAAHAKRRGRRAFHMGGVLQLLFGIKGRRWENPAYHPRYDYTTLFNDCWVRPGEQYRPPTADSVEGGCYW